MIRESFQYVKWKQSVFWQVRLADGFRYFLGSGAARSLAILLSHYFGNVLFHAIFFRALAGGRLSRVLTDLPQSFVERSHREAAIRRNLTAKLAVLLPALEGIEGC